VFGISVSGFDSCGEFLDDTPTSNPTVDTGPGRLGRFAAGGIFHGWGVVIVFDDDAIVDESCDTESVTRTTQGVATTEQSVTIGTAQETICWLSVPSSWKT
jgi:hypothetical protein